MKLSKKCVGVACLMLLVPATNAFAQSGESATSQNEQEKSKKGESAKRDENVKKPNQKSGIAPGKPLVTGSLDKDVIRSVIESNANPIRACYAKHLRKDKKLQGLVKVKFTIAGSGKVIAAMVSSSELQHKGLESCLTTEIRSWKFPEPEGGGIVVVNYPFNFSVAPEKSSD